MRKPKNKACYGEGVGVTWRRFRWVSSLVWCACGRDSTTTDTFKTSTPIY